MDLKSSDTLELVTTFKMDGNILMSEKTSLLIKVHYNHLRLVSQDTISVLPVNFKFCVYVAYNADDAGPLSPVPSQHSGPPSSEISQCLDHPHLKHPYLLDHPHLKHHVWTTHT
jgi:hypothetical protein